LQPNEALDSEAVKKLNCNYIIKGTFRHFGGSIRINTQLISTEGGRLIWAEKFEGALENIFSIQENIIEQVVASLQHYLNYELLADFKKKSLNANFDAYTYWLLGFTELKRGSVEADEKARGYFLKAIEVDHDYGRAYTGMSMSYFNEWSCQIWDRWEVSKKGAYEYAKKAFELDDQDHISSLVLGRVYLYNAEYEQAEHFIRRSIRLNPNDADNLVQAASSLTLLGYAHEAVKLYEKAINLNPVRNEKYRSYGSFIYFELGEYEKALELLPANNKFPWLDMPGFIAASYYMMGNKEKMQEYWENFISSFREKINNGKACTSIEAVEWMMRINPYKKKSNIFEFWNYIRGASDSVLDEKANDKKTSSIGFIFKEEDGFWKLHYEEKQVMMAPAKGLQDIYKLIIAQGKEIHCSELMGSAKSESQKYLVFDEKAKLNYRKKILNLQEEIAFAEENNNYSKAETLQQEYDQLLQHLSRSTGVGGRTRKAADSINKIRSAITWRIRNSILKIEALHPALGKHLSLSVKTGTFCCYSPEKIIDWVL
jgi:tetratricopeptide (TPR) repeat protein